PTLLHLACPYPPLVDFFSLHSYVHPRYLHSFPTRRSSDLTLQPRLEQHSSHANLDMCGHIEGLVLQAVSQGDIGDGDGLFHVRTDRKSTRLNSSHVKISYAVFCLKKKKNSNEYSFR